VRLVSAWLAEKLEIHYTPKHGSWLNMAVGRKTGNSLYAETWQLAEYG